MFTRLSGFTLKALHQIIQPLGDRTAQAPDSRQIPGGGASLESIGVAICLYDLAEIWYRTHYLSPYTPYIVIYYIVC